MFWKLHKKINIKYVIFFIFIVILIYACRPKVRTTKEDLQIMKFMQIYAEKADNCDEESIRYLHNYDRWNSSLRNSWVFNGAACGIADFEFIYLENFRSLPLEARKNRIQKVEKLITADNNFKNKKLYILLKKMKYTEKNDIKNK